MANKDWDFERIVREVIRRLQAMEATPVAGRGQLVVTDRLVTWQALEDRVAGVNSVMVPRGAVVTPLVRDELKDRNVKLLYSEAK